MSSRHRAVRSFFDLLGSLHRLIASTIENDLGEKQLLEYERAFREATEEIDFIVETESRDSLTNLRDKSFFEARLKEAIDEAREKGEQVAVIFLDLNRFKEINDRKGHGVGDDVLRVASIRIRRAARSVRSGDVVARWGGDEFALISNVPGEKEAVELASRISHAFETPISLGPGSTQLSVGVSIGIALGPRESEDLRGLIKRADDAMYRSKNTGIPWHLAD